MSAAHRSLARLPLEIYTDLICERGAQDSSFAENPELLRDAICNKLKKFPNRSYYRGSSSNSRGTVSFDSITTVGGILTRISKPSLLRVLDPLLTYEECDLFLRRIAHICTPKPVTALELLQETETIADLMSSSESNIHNNSQAAARDDDDHPWNHMRHLPTGLHSLDECLRGGLRVGTITEIVGRAGAGKTQFAMQLCVMAARYQQGCIYIDTEKKLSLPRLREIAEQRACCLPSSKNVAATTTNPYFSYDQSNNAFSSASALTHPPAAAAGDGNYLTLGGTDIPYPKPKDVLDNVTVVAPTTTSELLSSLVEVEELILVRNQEAADAKLRARRGHHHHSDHNNNNNNNNSHRFLEQQQQASAFPVRLLVLDSIAAPTKRGFGCESAPERAATIFQCAQRLKQLAHQLQIAVLVINQVFLDQQQQRGGGGESSLGSSTGDNSNSTKNTTEPTTDCVTVKAALGTSWHHCVSTRILLEEQQQQQQQQQSEEMIGNDNHHLHHLPLGGIDNNKENRTTRKATIVKSNVVGLQSTEFAVAGPGVVEATHFQP